MSETRKQRILIGARRQRQRRAVVTITVVAALIALLAEAIYLSTRNNTMAPNWPYPCLGQETLTFHIHPWLRIWIDNANVTIPAAIGITNPVFQNGITTGGPGSCFKPMHTHDASGIIHIEAQTAQHNTR